MDRVTSIKRDTCRSHFLPVLYTCAALTLSMRASADMTGIVVDRPPLNSGGPAADTAFINSVTLLSESQQLADSFSLPEYAMIRRITWWGFYTLDNPPLSEAIRIRFYESRSNPALPASIMMETTVISPARSATGRRVAVGLGPREFTFTTDLISPFAANADTTYWIEITQLGDISTAFRWEFSDGGDRFAFLNANVPDWQIATINGVNLALQLSTVPEPSSFLLGICSVSLVMRRQWQARRERPNGMMPLRAGGH